MLISDPHDALVLARERACRLREEAAPGHPGRPSATRRALAASLRRLADRLHPAPLPRHRPA
jgi:hypothetical protein